MQPDRRTMLPRRVQLTTQRSNCQALQLLANSIACQSRNTNLMYSLSLKCVTWANLNSPSQWRRDDICLSRKVCKWKGRMFVGQLFVERSLRLSHGIFTNPPCAPHTQLAKHRSLKCIWCASMVFTDLAEHYIESIRKPVKICLAGRKQLPA